MSWDSNGVGLGASRIKPRLFLLGTPGNGQRQAARAEEVRALYQATVDVVACLTLNAIRDAQLGALREEFALPGEAWLVRYEGFVTRERLTRNWLDGCDVFADASAARGAASR